MLRYILVMSCFLKVAVNFRREEQLLQYLQPDNTDDTMAQTSEYLCTRVCRQGEQPRVCYYQFTLEQYTVMGPACNGCPQNRTACYAPQCVAADGQEKMLLTVNRMLPGPSIQVCKGDTLIIDVANKMPGRSASIHWHGIRQVGTPYMDGMPMVTQCPILSSQIFRYKFKAADAGTFFWHSHDGAQKMDGILGSLIVREPRSEDPNSRLYDRDQPSHAMVVMDWMHTPSDDHLPGLLRNDRGQEPDSYLINGRGIYVPTVVATNLDTFKQQMQFMATGTTPTAVFVVKKGLRYRFRVIGGTCLSCPFQLFVEDHRLKLIAADMDSLEPRTVDSVVLASGERFDFVIEANRPSSAYWVFVKGLGACAKTTGVAILRYEDANFEKPLSPYPGLNGFPQGVVLNPRNSVCRNNNQNELCVTQVKSRNSNPDGLLKPIPDKRFVLRFGFYQYTPNELFRNREYYKFFLPYNPFTNQIPLLVSYVNNVTLAFPPSPLLTQLNDIPTSIFCSEQCSNESPVRCECLHILQAPLGSVIEFIIVDDAEPDAIAISHPFHIHGYEFSVMELGKFGDGDRKAQISNLIRRLESNPNRRSNILRKDTMAVPAAGYAVGRIVADNPGFWFIHCHFIYHLESGMAAILQVGEPNQFPSIPRGFPKCEEFTTPNADPL